MLGSEPTNGGPVTVGQAEFADLLVLTHGTGRRGGFCADWPLGTDTGGVDRDRVALAHNIRTTEGRTDTRTPLLAGLPPLAADGELRSWVSARRYTASACRQLTAAQMAWFALEVGVAGQPADRSCGSNRRWRSARVTSAGKVMVGGDGGLEWLCRPGAAVVRRPDVGLPVRRPAHRDDGTGMRRRSDRHRQCPERGAAQRRSKSAFRNAGSPMSTLSA